MREFFKGWRRKAGCVTLVMALATTSAWLRSFGSEDDFDFQFPSSALALRSAEGTIGCQRLSFDDMAFHTFKFHCFDSWYSNADFPKTATTKKAEWYGFEIESTSWTETRPPSTVKLELLVIPYWSLTIPLTLLSAYLILWKPRPKE